MNRNIGYSDLQKEGKELERKAVCIAGAAILDVLVTPAEPEVFHSGSYLSEDISMTFGADAMNESLVLNALGRKVYLNTVLGNDSQGEMIKNHCEKKGIQISDTCLKDGMKTGINVVLVRKDAERHFLTNWNGSLRQLTVEDIHLPLPEDAGIFCFASIFVFPKISPKEMADLFRKVKAQGVLICADMTKAKNGETVETVAEALPYIDYLMPNEAEAFLVTGEKDPAKAAAVLKAAGVKNVIIKCGKLGCYVLSDMDKEGYYVPAVEGVASIDTTGAGDSFAAGFMYGLGEGWEIRKCAEFANRCGACAVSEVGAAVWSENSETISNLLNSSC